MRRFFLSPLIVAFLCTISLTGCGVTKLWGDENTPLQNSARQGPDMREQADAIADPVWEIEEKRSMMNQMASVFVSGARSAGEALDVWTHLVRVHAPRLPNGPSQGKRKPTTKDK